MRARDVNLPAMAVASFICLVATGMALVEPERYARWAIGLFALAWIIFIAAVAKPIRLGRGSTDRE